MTLVLSILAETWRLVLASAAWLVAGFLLAGLIHVFLPVDRLKKWLGRRDWRSVFNAAAIGVPLPLCSCSVVPVASELRKAGASKGATTAFLISTPESGVDSISVTWALLDPLMTIARPLAAFLTAFAGGITQNVLDNRAERDAPHSATKSPSSCCAGRNAAPVALPVSPARPEPVGRCCSSRAVVPHAARDVSPETTGGSCCAPREPVARRSLPARLLAGLRYGAFDMFDDLAGFLAVGFLLAGALSVLLAAFEPLRAALHSPWAMLLMLAAGVPMYVCASASTPLVAVLIRDGLSPGAGLVFLLAGPATNAATLVVLQKVLGRRGLLVYLLSIGLCALLAGLLLNALYAWLALAPRALTHVHEHQHGDGVGRIVSLVAALALVALIARGLWTRFARRLATPNGGQPASATAHATSAPATMNPVSEARLGS